MRLATAGDVIEMSALVACGAGNATLGLFTAASISPTEGISSPWNSGERLKPTDLDPDHLALHGAAGGCR
jgi:hypothetical protein